MQSWFNREARGADQSGGTPYWYDSFDLEAQQNFALGGRQSFVVGAGLRDTWYRIQPLANFFYAPPTGSLVLGDVFGQDTVALTRRPEPHPRPEAGGRPVRRASARCRACA